MSASLTPIYEEAAPKSRTRDLPLMGEGTCHRTKCDLLLVMAFPSRNVIEVCLTLACVLHLSSNLILVN
ncbi:hypothetical protein ACFX13_021223 [Malus domestica]